MKTFTKEGKCVRVNRDRAAELTQPVWSGVGGQQQGKGNTLL